MDPLSVLAFRHHRGFLSRDGRRKGLQRGFLRGLVGNSLCLLRLCRRFRKAVLGKFGHGLGVKTARQRMLEALLRSVVFLTLGNTDTEKERRFAPGRMLCDDLL